MDKILDVWIVENSGICLFNQASGNTDENLFFSGFFSSIQTFLTYLGEGRIKKLELGENKIAIHDLDEYSLIFIIKSTEKTKDKFLEKKIKEIKKMFLEKYGKILQDYQKNNYVCDLKVFEDFHQYLDDILLNKMESNLVSWIREV